MSFKVSVEMRTAADREHEIEAFFGQVGKPPIGRIVGVSLSLESERQHT